jgi:hypothetical protein
MTNLVPGFLKADDFGKSWDREFNEYVSIFKEMGLIKQ